MLFSMLVVETGLYAYQLGRFFKNSEFIKSSLKHYKIDFNLLNKTINCCIQDVVVVVAPPPRISWSSHLRVPLKEANLDFYSWITSAASKGFFHRLVVLCYVGT